MIQRGSAPQSGRHLPLCPTFLNPKERLSPSQAALHASQPPLFTGGPRRWPAKLWVPVRRDGEFSFSIWVQRNWTISRDTNCFHQGKPDRLGEELHSHSIGKHFNLTKSSFIQRFLKMRDLEVLLTTTGWDRITVKLASLEKRWGPPTPP